MNLPLLAGANAVEARKARRPAQQVPAPTLFDTQTNDTATPDHHHRTDTDTRANPVPPLRDSTATRLPDQLDALAFRNAPGESDWETTRWDGR